VKLRRALDHDWLDAHPLECDRRREASDPRSYDSRAHASSVRATAAKNGAAGRIAAYSLNRRPTARQPSAVGLRTAKLRPSKNPAVCGRFGHGAFMRAANAL